MGAKDNRKYLRFNVILEAICRKGGILKKVKVNNFSKEGVGILSDETLNKGEDLEMEMMIPGDNIPVIIEGQIAWTSEAASKDDAHKAGVKLKKIKASDRGRILEYIYNNWVKTTGDENKKSETEEK